jgi:hypothetical protein
MTGKLNAFIPITLSAISEPENVTEIQALTTGSVLPCMNMVVKQKFQHFLGDHDNYETLTRSVPRILGD